MNRGLLAAWVGLLMASRIDLLGGAGPLVLTPFLILSPALLAVELMRCWAGRRAIRIPSGTTPFLLTLTALFIVLLGSTFLAYELAVSARRLALLVAQAYMVFLVTLVIANRPDPQEVLLKGAYFGLAATGVLNVLQAVVFLAEPGWAQTASALVDLQPGTYFGVIPRLTGLSHDPNHGGLFAVFLMWLVTWLAPPSRRRTWFVAIGVASVVATLSRSAVLAGLTLWAMTWLAGREVRVSVRAVAAGAVVAAAVTIGYVVAPGWVEPLENLGGMLSTRLSPDEGSSSEHARLLALGWEVGTDNLRNLSIGIGYGNAFVVTQDIFPGNEYGNFHSLFLTLFVEAGVLALGIGLWLFAWAVRVGGRAAPMVLALFAFNLFQQSHTEPILWLVLMLAWVPFVRPEGGHPPVPREAYDAPGPGPVPAP